MSASEAQGIAPGGAHEAAALRHVPGVVLWDEPPEGQQSPHAAGLMAVQGFEPVMLVLAKDVTWHDKRSCGPHHSAYYAHRLNAGKHARAVAECKCMSAGL